MPTILDKHVGSIGLGLLNLTNPAKNLSHEQGFAVLKQSLESGATFWECAHSCVLDVLVPNKSC